MTKALLYAFGPDGAGKSTIIGDLSSTLAEGIIIPGSQPARWPDQSWHEEITARDIDPTTTDPAYHLETLSRCYRMVGSLLRETAAPVIIDSDPRAQIAAKACSLYDTDIPLETLYDQLDDMAQAHVDDDVHQIGLHVTVGQGTPEERASTLLRRIAARGDASTFDPSSMEQARDLVVAFDGIEALLQQRGAACLHIDTDHFSASPLTPALMQTLSR